MSARRMTTSRFEATCLERLANLDRPGAVRMVDARN